MRVQKLGWILAGLVLTFLLGSGNALAHKEGVDLSISLDPNPATDGTSVDITGTLLYTGTRGAGSATGHGDLANEDDPVQGETVKIEQRQLDGVGVSCATVGAAFVEIFSNTTDSNGEVLYAFDTTGLGGNTIGFRAHHAAEGGSHGSEQAQSPCVDLVITLDDCEGAIISATFADGDGTPSPALPLAGPWTFLIEVTACEALNGVSAQGGTNGWAPMTGFAPSTGSVNVRQNKKNQVLTWTIGNMGAGQTETLEVTVDGGIKPGTPDGTILFLSGPWSTTFSTDGGTTFQKSEYTGRVTVTVDNP